VAVSGVAMLLVSQAWPAFSRELQVIWSLLGALALGVGFARRDALGFASLAVPLLVVGLVEAFGPVALADGAFVAGLVYLLVIAFGANDLWAWWSRRVLRRMIPSKERTFELALNAAQRPYKTSTWQATPNWRPDAMSEAARQRALADVMSLTPPNQEWTALRNAIAELLAAEATWLGRDVPTTERFEHLTEWAHVSDFQMMLRGREDEWRGPFPTLPEAEISSRKDRVPT
jgi:hypothetical protein